MLESIRILDLSHRLAGPMATSLLAEMGAHVIKVESPAGDLTRESEPQLAPGVSEYFALANQSKDVVCIDLKNPAGHAAFLRLVQESDALLDNFRPGVLERLGLGSDVLERANPALTHVALSGFGATGPYRDKGGVDILAQALAGMMSVTGEPDGPPVPAGIAVGDVLGGLYAALALVSGVLGRDRGSTVAPSADVSLLNGLIHSMGLWSVRWLNGGDAPARLGAETPHVAPYGRYATSDGWIVIAARGEEYWRRIASVLGLEPLLDDPRFAGNIERIKHRAVLERLIGDAVGQRSTADWLDRFGDLPVAPVNDVPAAIRDPQILATKSIVEMHANDGSMLRVPRSAIRWNDAEPSRRIPGQLGADTARILASVAGFSADEIAALAADGAVILGSSDNV